MRLQRIKFVKTNAGTLYVNRAAKGGSQNNYRNIQFYCANTGANQSVGIFTAVVELNGSTDYLEAQYVNLAATTTVFGNNDDNYFTAYRIGA